jgi:putative redox protein
MGEQLEVTINSTDLNVQCAGVARSNPAIIFDYRAPLGEGDGYTPLELLLMSLAVCSVTTIVYLLRKMKKNIMGFNVNAKGIRRDTHPTSLEQIALEFKLDSPDTTAADIQKAIKMSEETYCPVWAMLKNSVEIKTGFKINSCKC